MSEAEETRKQFEKWCESRKEGEEVSLSSAFDGGWQARGAALAPINEDFEKLCAEICRVYTLLNSEWADADADNIREEFDPWDALRDIEAKLGAALAVERLGCGMSTHEFCNAIVCKTCNAALFEGKWHQLESSGAVQSPEAPRPDIEIALRNLAEIREVNKFCFKLYWCDVFLNASVSREAAENRINQIVKRSAKKLHESSPAEEFPAPASPPKCTRCGLGYDTRGYEYCEECYRLTNKEAEQLKRGRPVGEQEGK